ncbi:hypothetical protein KIW84_060293 [Lathyrus oleraceus]|uniref:Reverse transcriptase zinc-binding domain-containing protein n=1 Tax=Pisum sativum TaxID=3888 RepID=A0A9D5A501_PEA|nr:hypothetical protein KIW84_060293 [Pisum sativum]
MISNRMRVKTVTRHSKYLGLPVVFGRSKKDIFSLVVEGVWKKVKGWKETFLSRGGKEGSKNGESKIHWMGWDRMSGAKGIGGCWNVGLVQYLFDPVEASQIIDIPLSFRRPQDELIWHNENYGSYFVRYAYHTFFHDKASKKPSPLLYLIRDCGRSCGVHISALHSGIFYGGWPRIFSQQGSIFSKKGINLDTSCPLCRAASETSQRLFMQCKFFKLVCFSLSLGFRIPENSDLNDWLLLCLTCDNLLKSQLMCTTLWKTWCARNKCHFQQKIRNPQAVAVEVMESVQEFNKETPTKKVQGN